MSHKYTAYAALLGGAAVLLGAFGAHALKATLDSYALEIWRTAVFYHLTHAVAILALSMVAFNDAEVTRLWALRALFIGTVIFSGSLYLLALTSIKLLGGVTPVGGLCLMVGWLLVFIAAYQNSKTEQT